MSPILVNKETGERLLTGIKIIQVLADNRIYHMTDLQVGTLIELTAIDQRTSYEFSYSFSRDYY